MHNGNRFPDRTSRRATARISLRLFSRLIHSFAALLCGTLLTNARASDLAQFTVTFDLDGRATAEDPAALTQTVPEGGDATAPVIHVEPSWIFTGWDAPLTGITANRTLTAQYASDIDQDGVADTDDPNPDGLPDAATARQALDLYTGIAEAPHKRPLPESPLLPADHPDGEVRFRFYENADPQGLQPIPEWSRNLLLEHGWNRRGLSLDRGPVEDGRRVVEARLPAPSDDAPLFFRLRVANPPPNPGDDQATLTGNDPATLDLLANDDNAGGESSLSVTALQGDPDTIGHPLDLPGGSVTVTPDGTATLTPDPALAAGEQSTATLSYTVTDPFGRSAHGTLALDFYGVNDPPVASSPNLTVTEGENLTLHPEDFGSDVDNGDTLGFTELNGEPPPTEGQAIELPSIGHLIRATDGTLLFEPTNRFGQGIEGSESFTYTLEDHAGATDEGTATITVIGVNDPPVAAPDSFTVRANDLLDPDNLEPGLQWSFYEIDGPVTADTDFAGLAPVAGGFLSSLNEDLDPATVDPFPATGEDKATAYVIHGFLEVPQDDLYTFFLGYVNEHLLPGRHHIEVAGAPLIDRLNEPVFDLTAPVSLTAGVHPLTLMDTAYEGDGGPESIAELSFAQGFYPTLTRALETFGIGGEKLDDPQGPGQPLRPKPLPSSLFANDTDPDDGDTLTPVAINGHSVTPGMGVILPSGAFAAIDADGGLRYNPTPADALRSLGSGETFTDTFTYTVADQAGATDQSTVEVTVEGVDEPPIARADLFEPPDTALDAPIDIPSVLANDLDHDPDGSLTVVAVDGSAANVGQPVPLPSGATVTLQADGTGTYDAVGVPLLPHKNSGESKVETTEIIDGEEVVTGHSFEVHPAFADDGGAILEGDYVIEQPLTYTVENAAGQQAQAALHIRVEGSTAGPASGANGDFSGPVPLPEAIGSTSQTSQYALTNLEEGAIKWATNASGSFQTDIIPEGVTRTYKADYDEELEIKQYGIKIGTIQPDLVILPDFKNAIEVEALCKTSANLFRYAITNRSDEEARLIVNGEERLFDPDTTTEIEDSDSELTVNVGNVNLGRFQGSEDPCQDFNVSFDKACRFSGTLFLIVSNHDDVTRYFEAESTDGGNSESFSVDPNTEGHVEQLNKVLTTGNVKLRVGETQNGPWIEVDTRSIDSDCN